MLDKIDVFITKDDAIEQLLFENNINITQILYDEGIDSSLKFIQDPANTNNTGYKEPVTVILVSAGAILAVTPILKNIIENIARKPILVKQKRLKPVEDSRGKVVYDKDGKPQMYWEELNEFIEPTQSKLDKQSVKIKGPMKIELSFESERKI